MLNIGAFQAIGKLDTWSSWSSRLRPRRTLAWYFTGDSRPICSTSYWTLGPNDAINSFNALRRRYSGQNNLKRRTPGYTISQIHSVIVALYRTLALGRFNLWDDASIARDGAIFFVFKMLHFFFTPWTFLIALSFLTEKRFFTDGIFFSLLVFTPLVEAFLKRFSICNQCSISNAKFN